MEKKIVCFFITDHGIVPVTRTIDAADANAEAKSISEIVRDPEFKFYNLAFVLDSDSETYHAEYLKGLADFQSRKQLLNMMETVVKTQPNEFANLTSVERLAKRSMIRSMPENEWIEEHASGTLRKNKRIGFSYRLQYLAERVAYEFGYGFEILPRSKIAFGDPLTEENCGAITEAGWHIERYINMDIFGDYMEAKYIYATERDGKVTEGLGIIVRETSAPWVPAGHIIFAIIAEFDTVKKVWKDAINPF